METNRLALDTRIRELFGFENVYFQPPNNVQMKYPAIVYERHGGDTTFANNKPYRFTISYDVTIIDKTPNNSLVEKFGKELEGAVYDRHFVVDNLHHDVFLVNYPHDR